MLMHPSLLSNPATGQVLKLVDNRYPGELIMDARYRARSREPLPHYHPVQEEHFEVLTGELTVRLEGRLHTLTSGDTLHIRPGQVHSMWNAADRSALVRWTTRPALRTEEFHRIIFGLAEEGLVNDEGVPGLLQVSLLAKEFDNEFRLANPPRWVQQIVFCLLRPLARLVGLRSTYPARALRPVKASF